METNKGQDGRKKPLIQQSNNLRKKLFHWRGPMFIGGTILLFSGGLIPFIVPYWLVDNLSHEAWMFIVKFCMFVMILGSIPLGFGIRYLCGRLFLFLLCGFCFFGVLYLIQTMDFEPEILLLIRSMMVLPWIWAIIGLSRSP